MKVRFDRELCTGHGRCYMLAPDVYSEDERGHCQLRHESVTGALLASARLGAEACPEQAISLDED